MIRLSGQTHYLVLLGLASGRHSLAVVRKFPAALALWSDALSARMSPIYPAEGFKFPPLRGRTSVLLAGPISPGTIPPDLAKSLALTLGTYNTVFFPSTKKEQQAILAFLSTAKCHFEQWTLDNQFIVTSRNNNSKSVMPMLPKELLAELPLPLELQSTWREYQTLLACTWRRAERYQASQAALLLDFDRSFRRLLSATGHSIQQQTLLVNANAALSRYSSQAFAGVSPVMETECHFWPHSLLGIGTASRALQNLQTHINSALESSRLIDRLELLGSTQPHHDAGGVDLLGLDPADQFWRKEHLFRPDISARLPVTDGDLDVQQIAFFSGRDGFRSTPVSLSAPLEAVTACNAQAWTLATVTHEISHIWIESALALIIPDLGDDSSLERALEVTFRNVPSRSMLEQLSAGVCWTAVHIAPVAPGGTAMQPQEFGAAITHAYKEINECMTHAFDFLYFYDRQVRPYLTSIWSSWAVIPNVSARVEEYLVRTLCAVLAGATRERESTVIADTIAVVRAELEDIGARNELARRAATYLVERRAFFETQLTRRSILARVVRAFLFQPSVAQRLLADSTATRHGRKGTPQLRPLEFGGHTPKNPLRFVSAFGSESHQNATRSAWMLMMLAFGATAP